MFLDVEVGGRNLVGKVGDRELGHRGLLLKEGSIVIEEGYEG